MQPVPSSAPQPTPVPWYYRKWAVVLALILLFPVGLVLVWKSPVTKTSGRVAWTVAICLFLLLRITDGGKQTPKDAKLEPQPGTTNTAAPVSVSKKIKWTAQAALTANGAIQVKGDTDLPDGTIITAGAYDGKGILLGSSSGVHVSQGTYEGSVTLQKMAAGDIRVRVSLDPWPGQPATTKALVGEQNEKLKELLPDGFAFGPNVMTKVPSAYIDLKLTLSATAKVPADRKAKVLADGTKIAALEVRANTLTQQAQEVFQTYYGINNAKGQQLIDSIFSELDMVMAQLDGSAKENLAPEVVPYEDALGAEVVSKMNGVSKWVDAVNGSKGAAGEAPAHFAEATKKHQVTDAALKALASKLDVSADTLMGR